MEYSSGDIIKRTNLNYRSLQFYYDRGLVKPIKGGKCGRGAKKKFDSKALCEFIIISDLLRFKMNVHQIRDILNAMRRDSRCRNFLNGTFTEKEDSGYFTCQRTEQGRLKYLWKRPSVSAPNHSVLEPEDIEQTVAITIDLAAIAKSVYK